MKTQSLAIRQIPLTVRPSAAYDAQTETDDAAERADQIAERQRGQAEQPREQAAALGRQDGAGTLPNGEGRCQTVLRERKTSSK